ncbi:MAG: RNA polymerase sigma factor [Terriglobales bacterium]
MESWYTPTRQLGKDLSAGAPLQHGSEARARPDRGAAAQFGVSPVQARRWLHEVEARHLPAGASARARRQFRQRLHVDDLILARACAEGCEAAWEQLWRRAQPRLRAAAHALTHDCTRAHELADSLLGDLFAAGAANSKLRSYSGLGSLEAWLCTLLAQAHVNRWRQERKQVSLEECGTLQFLLVPPQFDEPAASSAERTCLELALAHVLARLLAPVRLLLCLYFLDGRTLAEIAVVVRVHESTVSRRLAHALVQLRRDTRRELRALGLRPTATEAVLRTDPRWLRLDVRHALRAQPQEGPHAL